MLRGYFELEQDRYNDLRYKLLLNVEENGIPKRVPYADSVGIPTIGVGFNLRDPNVRNAVLKGLGISVGKAAESAYVLEIETIINRNDLTTAQRRDALNDVMRRRAADVLVVDATGATKRTAFEFRSDAEIRAVFEALISDYEDIVDQFVPDIPNSRERLALVALAWNNPALLGPNLQNALQTGNRAEAWYEIRYNSNGGASASPGIAKGRYYESEIFGLFDPIVAPPTPEDERERAMAVYRMYTAHRPEILDYEQRYGSGAAVNQIVAARRDYKSLGMGEVVRTLEESLAPAFEYLLAHDMGLAGSVEVDFRDVQVGSAAGETLTGTVRDGFRLNVGPEKDDLILGEAGDDELQGMGGNDYLFGGDDADRLIGGGWTRHALAALRLSTLPLAA